MSRFPRDINLCQNVDCPDRKMGGHHHLHHGPEDVSTHGGTLFECAESMCKAYVEQLTQAEAEQAVDDDLVGEAMRIAEWWVQTAKKDAERTVPKAVEYGAADFDLMGQFMVALLGEKLNGADDAEKMRVGREMAVLFYLIGKMGRAVGAYARGVLPSDDTIFDSRIYAMMWQRIRETGHWIEGK